MRNADLLKALRELLEASQGRASLGAAKDTDTSQANADA